MQEQSDITTGDGEIASALYVECDALLGNLDRHIASLGRVPGEQVSVKPILDSLSALKVNSGFLGFQKIEILLSAAMGLARQAIRLSEPGSFQAMMARVATEARRALSAARNGAPQSEIDFGDVLSEIRHLSTEADALNPVRTLSSLLPGAPAGPSSAPLLSVVEIGMLGSILVELGKVEMKEVVAAVDEQRNGDSRRLGEILVAKGQVQPGDVRVALATQRARTEQVIQQAEGSDDLEAAIQALVEDLYIFDARIEQLALSKSDRECRLLSGQLGRTIEQLDACVRELLRRSR